MAVKAKAEITIYRVVDVDKVTRYYLLQSSTVAAPSKPADGASIGSNWSTTEPSYSSGSTMTLYFVDQTVLSNGTIKYSEVSKSSSYEAAKEAWNKADHTEERVKSVEATIEQQQESITLMVKQEDFTGNTIIGKINLDSTTVAIDAKHIDLKGAVTISALASETKDKLDTAVSAAEQVSDWKYTGSTYIDGGKIYTGSIKADQIDVEDLFAQDITAVNMTIAGGVIQSQNYVKNKSGTRMDVSNGAIEIYSTTDLATIRTRIGGDQLLSLGYTTDEKQGSYTEFITIEQLSAKFYGYALTIPGYFQTGGACVSDSVKMRENAKITFQIDNDTIALTSLDPTDPTGKTEEQIIELRTYGSSGSQGFGVAANSGGSTAYYEIVRADGHTHFPHNLMCGNKTGYLDGKQGVYLQQEGYIHIQRGNTSVNPYIGFFRGTGSTTTSTSAMKQLYLGSDNYFHMNTALQLQGGNGSNGFAIITETSTGNVHSINSKSSGLNISGRWGTSSWSTRSLTVSSSDQRLKKDIKESEIASALNVIRQIRMHAFDWKDSGMHQRIGFLADELEQIDERLTEGGGWNEDGSMNVKTVDTFYLLGYLTQGIQELTQMVEELKKELNEVKRA